MRPPSPASRILCQIAEKVGRTGGESVGYNEKWGGCADYFGKSENGDNKDAHHRDPHDHTALARKNGWVRLSILGQFPPTLRTDLSLLPADSYEIEPRGLGFGVDLRDLSIKALK